MITTQSILATAVAVSALAANPAFAHEKGDRAMGVVDGISADRIVGGPRSGIPSRSR